MLSLIASGLYGLTMIACLGAAATAVRARQFPDHRRLWLVLAMFFLLLAAWRILALEEMVRDFMRQGLKAEGAYADRRSWQTPLVAAIIALAGVGALRLIYRLTRNLRGRRNKARVVAIVAAFFLLVLIALRLASLHVIDALLYGPLKLNWVIDVSATFVVLGAAAYYIRLVRAEP